MTFTHFIGIDVSKKKLDLCLFNGKEVLLELECPNSIVAIKKVLKEIIKESKINATNLLICAEFTGMYIYPLVESSKALTINLWLETGSQIKLSSGVQRGKNDKVDAKRIALYAHRFNDKAKIYQAADEVIERLKYLNSEREMLVVDKAKYQGQLNDQGDYMLKAAFKEKEKRLKELIKGLNKAIKSIERQTKELVEKDLHIKQQFEQMISIDGVGKQVALETLIVTQGFKAFTEPRQFCCHAGVAPFAYTSGSSQRSKWKVSNRANKRLKQLFHMAALSAIKMKGELRDYFLRKVAEGKNKMTVINAVRAKLIHRIFAVIRDNRKYEKIYTNPLA